MRFVPILAMILSATRVDPAISIPPATDLSDDRGAGWAVIGLARIIVENPHGNDGIRLPSPSGADRMLAPQIRLGIAVILSGLVLVVGCDTRETNDDAPPPGRMADLFADRAESSGLDFVHFNGMTGEMYIVETMGAGGALFDYDGDGDLDALLIQGELLEPGTTLEDAIFPPASGQLGDRLFRNEWNETGRLEFTDVTESAGLGSGGYGMGVAIGDYDGDGRRDLYLTAFGSNRLLHNEGDGTFEDMTAFSGTDDESWSTSAVFLDYDADGRLDLFVVNYVRFNFSNHRPCYGASTQRDYCGPESYEPYPDRLFRNRGDGTFEDVTATSGIARHYGAGLGVMATDVNGDDKIDLYVANDADPNQLWINRGDGTFVDESLISGCAFNRDGKAEASMGLAVGDYDGDGDDDVFVTHLDEETNTLYANNGKGMFDDVTMQSGLGTPSLSYTSFGTSWLDFDNDGWLDLFVANGAVYVPSAKVGIGERYPLDQPNQLFRNLGRGRFEDVSMSAGVEFERSEVSRGSAFGDVDNDGDTDILLFNNAGRARLLINQVGERQNWIGIEVHENEQGTDSLGTRVELVRDDGSTLWRRVRAATSYCSSSDPRVRFGLGDRNSASTVRVHWSDGQVETWNDLPQKRYTVLVRGAGTVEGH